MRQNPLLEAAQLKEEKTIEEMQAFVFDQRYYEYDNATDEMLFYPEAERGSKAGAVKVQGKEFEGMGLQKESLVEHVRALRALAYQIINALVLGNAKSSMTLA